jgi:putative ATPase
MRKFNLKLIDYSLIGMTKPLATILRPKNLDEFLGQNHLVGKNSPIKKMLDSGKISSMIFWGPPASGKTTLAEIIAQNEEYDFLKISAVMDGKEALKRVLDTAKANENWGIRTILFIDEIHRWNKAQQDALLPHIESGVLTLIGATTENPSFTVNSALLSRTRVFVFYPLEESEVLIGLQRGFEYLSRKGSTLILQSSTNFDSLEETPKIKDFDPLEGVNGDEKQAVSTLEALKLLAEISDGDIRFALNSLEIAYNSEKDGKITKENIESAVQKFLRHDKHGEEHYNLISAVHKSLRSSNPTGAVYWMTRMLQAGEDPLYIARRMLRFASEDIGNSCPTAILLANTVYETCQKLGMPECDTALVQLAEYLARAPKNNSAYMASIKAKEDVSKFGNLPVPLHFRNAPTKLMKDLGYSKGYEYDHDLEGKKSDQQCMPDKLKSRNYFE